MGGASKTFSILAAGLCLGAMLGGCGSGTTGDTTANGSRPYPWLKGPSREFLVPGGDNVVQTFGEEGTPGERAAASALIASWLSARAATNWKADCSYFSRGYARLLAADASNVTNGRTGGCPEALAFFGPNASGNYVNTLDGPIDSLRVGEGQRVGGEFGEMAFAQYHGTDGRDWVVPLEREGGEWKVAKAAPIDRLK